MNVVIFIESVNSKAYLCYMPTLVEHECEELYEINRR